MDIRGSLPPLFADEQAMGEWLAEKAPPYGTLESWLFRATSPTNGEAARVGVVCCERAYDAMRFGRSSRCRCVYDDPLDVLGLPKEPWQFTSSAPSREQARELVNR